MKKILTALICVAIILSICITGYAEPSDGNDIHFDITPKEFITRFNNDKDNPGTVSLIADDKYDECELVFEDNDSKSGIQVQFVNYTGSIEGMTTGAGLKNEKFNWIYAYIVTDEDSIDVDTLSMLTIIEFLFANALGLDFDLEKYMSEAVISGTLFPTITYVNDNVKYMIQFRDASVGNLYQTVYSASIMVGQAAQDIRYSNAS